MSCTAVDSMRKCYFCASCTEQQGKKRRGREAEKEGEKAEKA